MKVRTGDSSGRGELLGAADEDGDGSCGSGGRVRKSEGRGEADGRWRKSAAMSPGTRGDELAIVVADGGG